MSEQPTIVPCVPCPVCPLWVPARHWWNGTLYCAFCNTRFEPPADPDPALVDAPADPHGTARADQEDPSTSTLTPELTRFDKRVLSYLPAWWDEETDKPGGSIDAWRLGYEMRHLDVPELVQTLRGLEQMGYVCHIHSGSYRSGYDVWHRTQSGDRAAAPTSGTEDAG